MPATHLLIPDSALNEAVAEQLALEGLGTLQAGGQWPAAPPTETTLLVVDEAAFGPECAARLAALRSEHLVTIWLGRVPGPMDSDLIADVIEKPVRLGHLIGRIRLHLAIPARARAAPVPIGPYQFESAKRRLTAAGQEVRLTEKESALLDYLARSAGPVSRDDLLANVWGYDARVDTHTLETHIYQLRRKLGGELILNDNGRYSLVKT